MATQNPALPIGQWVQYNSTVDNPRTSTVSPQEKTIGIIRNSFTQGDGQYYQVVWNPGEQLPRSALYHASELTPLSQQSAMQIIGQMNAGTYQPPDQVAGSNYQQPNVPIQAAPPANQQPGLYTL